MPLSPWWYTHPMVCSRRSAPRPTLHGARIAWIALWAFGCGPAAGDAGSQSGADSNTSPPTSGSSTTAGSTTSGGTTVATTGPPTVAPPTGCACAESELCSGLSTGVAVECGGEELCPRLVSDCARPVEFYSCGGQDLILDEAALSCALDALAERTPGWFDISLEDNPTGYCGFEPCVHDVRRVQVRAEADLVVVANCSDHSLSEPDFNNTVRDLESPAHFENCKSLPSAAAKLDCLFEGLQFRAFVDCD